MSEPWIGQKKRDLIAAVVDGKWPIVRPGYDHRIVDFWAHGGTEREYQIMVIGWAMTVYHRMLVDENHAQALRIIELEKQVKKKWFFYG